MLCLEPHFGASSIGDYGRCMEKHSFVWLCLLRFLKETFYHIVTLQLIFSFFNSAVIETTLKRKPSPSLFGGDIEELAFYAEMESDNRLRFKVHTNRHHLSYPFPFVYHFFACTQTLNTLTFSTTT